MSKFTKKSLAVLTTAAIMASTATITASAMSLTIPADLTVTSRGAAVTTNANFNGRAGDDLTWTTPDGKVVKINGKEATSPYTITNDDETNGITMTVEDVKTGSEPTPAGDENFDHVVWVNGKDVKAQAAKGDKPATAASLYKTEQYDQVMYSAGGKWQVAVTDTTINTVEAFLEKFDTKGKFDSATAKEMKAKASAKIKEGTITVTAGKEGGEVLVWVYEVKNKAVVNDTFGEAKVEPKSTAFTVKVAPSLATTAKATTVKDGAVEKIEVQALEKTGYAAGSEVLVYLGDKKNAVSLDATYALMDGKNAAEVNEEGKWVTEKFTAELVGPTAETGPAVKITIAATATDKDKINVSVKNVESGKIAKISPKVAKAESKDDDKGGSEGGEGGSEGGEGGEESNS